jgi:uncharacterized protein (DUF736 family)
MKLNKNNVKIGTFTPDHQGILKGRIYWFGFGSVDVALMPQTTKSGQSYCRLVAAPNNMFYEIGVAFPKEKNGILYHSIIIDSPMLREPIKATLFQDTETRSYNLFWNRTEGNSPKVANNVQSPARSATFSPMPA